jgi:hypothetical protein
MYENGWHEKSGKKLYQNASQLEEIGGLTKDNDDWEIWWYDQPNTKKNNV